MHVAIITSIDDKPEPNMLKILPTILSSTSQTIYPLFLFYSHINTSYQYLLFLFYLFCFIVLCIDI